MGKVKQEKRKFSRFCYLIFFRMKYRKYFKIKYKNNNALQYDSIHFGSVALKSLSQVNLTLEQLTAAVKSIKRIIKKKNFLVIRALPF